ncbi:hypothetical protein CP532_4497 [Ophiocordyceps camponoti-leonardi (nom. inval.)]|nr:hypothetical protein CP532_4497 [Ophiocordyceps camponoti-leonardi (nom. inval.)]
MASREQTPSSSSAAAAAVAAAAAAAAAHAYASNGLEMLQAASDAAAAQAIEDSQALHDAVEAVADLAPQPTSLPPAPPHPHPPPPQQQQQQQQPSSSPPLGGLVVLGRDPTINPKLTRLRRACDMCSMRKVKCDDSSIPCRPCRELGVDCTYERETKRRGPPNKHAEAAKAAKRARVDVAVVPSSSSTAAASPSPHNAAKTLVSISADAVVDADAIAPLPVLEHLVDDFFTYVHPLSPFPHEPTFRQSFANREDRTRPEFLGLLAAMVAALVASFPRSAREHLKAQHGSQLFPRPVAMVDRCRDVALITRGSRWVLKQPKTLDDTATSYFLGLASAYAGQWNASRYFLAETLTLIRELGFSRPKHPGHLPTFGNDAYSADPLPFNHVKDQIGKRIFWCLLLGVRSFSQFGASQSTTDLVIAPSTPSLPYPAYPDNVDDICVLANEVMHQPEGSVTLLTGFRFAIDIYTTMNGIVSLELAYGMSTLPWADQRLLLRDGLVAAKSIVDNLPPELQLGSQLGVEEDGDDDAATADAGLQYVPPGWPNPQPAHDVRAVIKAHPHRRRQLQHEIQKANIFVSQLATRAYFVDLYFNLRDVHLSEQQQQQRQEQEDEKEQVEKAQQQDDETQEQHQQEEEKGEEQEQLSPSEKLLQDEDDKEMLQLMSQERELLVQNLLTIIGSLSQRNMEPNGAALISKLRHVALSLLHDRPERKGPFAMKADEALAQLVVSLTKLGGFFAEVGGGDQVWMTDGDEVEEMGWWAELRELQLRFAADDAFGDHLGG